MRARCPAWQNPESGRSARRPALGRAAQVGVPWLENPCEVTAMRYSKPSRIFLCGAIALSGAFTWSPASAARSAPGADQQPVAGTWQHHSGTFHYFGIIARYSCAGIEDHVRSLLL